MARSKLLINKIKRDNIISASELGLLPPKTRNGALGHKYASSFLTQKPSILKKSLITNDIVETPKRSIKIVRPQQSLFFSSQNWLVTKNQARSAQKFEETKEDSHYKATVPRHDNSSRRVGESQKSTAHSDRLRAKHHKRVKIDCSHSKSIHALIDSQLLLMEE